MDNLRESIAAAGGECLVLEPPYFDQAAIDIVTVEGFLRVRYNTRKIVELLQTQDDMSEEDAWDWYCFNIEGAYMGPTTPIYLDPDTPLEDVEQWSADLQKALDDAVQRFERQHESLFAPDGSRRSDSNLARLFWAGYDNQVIGSCWDVKSQYTQDFAYWRAGREANPLPYLSNPAPENDE